MLTILSLALFILQKFLSTTKVATTHQVTTIYRFFLLKMHHLILFDHFNSPISIITFQYNTYIFVYKYNARLLVNFKHKYSKWHPKNSCITLNDSKNNYKNIKKRKKNYTPWGGDSWKEHRFPLHWKNQHELRMPELGIQNSWLAEPCPLLPMISPCMSHHQSHIHNSFIWFFF